jgi:signal transduction histidine kinase
MGEDVDAAGSANQTPARHGRWRQYLHDPRRAFCAFRVLYATAPVLITVTNLVPNIEPELLVATAAPSGEFVFCNPAWRHILGPAKTPWMCLSDEDTRRASDGVLKAADGSLMTNQVVQAHTTKRDEPLPVLLHFLPVHTPSESDPHAVKAVTITGEVMAEPASWTVNQTEQHRMESLGRMTMGITHDFNNLLSGLLGHVELLKDEAAEADVSSGFRDSLRTIEQVAEDGGALIRKLQQYIRQDSEVHFEPLDLTALLEDCIALTQPYWYNEPRRQGITIDLEKTFEDVPTTMGSPTELREVFVNLILNAVQAMPQGGTLSFWARPTDEGGVRIQIQDTGIGMSKDVQAHIFEPLFTTKGQEGTGMGLAVSYGIVQEHDGTITVNSTPEVGTTFTLTFPPSAPSDASLPTAVETPAPAEVNPAHVLVVDDEEMVRTVITKLLNLHGHTVRQAASGPEALDLVASDAPDIVFTDYGMPEMCGAELAKQLRAQAPSLPIVLISGDTETGDAVPFVDAIIDKPFKLDDLESAIQDLLSPHSGAPQ